MRCGWRRPEVRVPFRALISPVVRPLAARRGLVRARDKVCRQLLICPLGPAGTYGAHVACHEDALPPLGVSQDLFSHQVSNLEHAVAAALWTPAPAGRPWLTPARGLHRKSGLSLTFYSTTHNDAGSHR
jgi:hypothetical protein